MRKYLLTLICFVGLVLPIKAQKTYVVAFDCTKSMNHPNGDYSVNGLDTSVLWHPAKENIHSLWDQADNEDTFHIILFQNKILNILSGTKSILSWTKIEREMNRAVTQGGNTCIYNAWISASKYFTDDCDFYLITDGVEDHDNNNHIDRDEQTHIDAICSMINEFCDNKCHGFYTNLQESKNAKINNQITEAVKQSSCFRKIVGGNIKPNSISLNQIDINNCGKTFQLRYDAIDKGQSPNVTEIHAEIINDDYPYLSNVSDYFIVSASDIKNDTMTLTIKTTGKNVPTSQLNNNNECQFRIRVFSTGKQAIFPQVINVSVRYYIEKIAFLPLCDFKGESNYHPAFFIKQLVKLFPKCDLIAEHNPDTISFDLKAMLDDNRLFNDEAIKHGSSYKLQLVPIRDKDKNAKFILLKNGEICKNNTINVASSDENILIKIIFDKASEDGTFKFNLVPIEPNRLDKINECANINEASVPLIIEFDKDYNPLDFLLVCLLCIISACCLIRILYYHLRRGVYCGIDYIINGSQEVLVKKRKANRIVISSKVKKQNWIDWLFNGKTLHNVEPVYGIKSDICFNAARLKRTMRVKCQENNDYYIDGGKMRRQILIADENIEHIITDTDNVELLTLIVF